jgi:hypothetical protein
MTDELTLYHRDREAWLAMVAPRMPPILDANTDAELAMSWGLMSRDYQQAVWAHLSEAQRERVRRLRKEAA